jgi:hypothetical protein
MNQVSLLTEGLAGSYVFAYTVIYVCTTSIATSK